MKIEPQWHPLNSGNYVYEFRADQLPELLRDYLVQSVTSLALMSIGLIERLNDGWTLTDAGRLAFVAYRSS